MALHLDQSQASLQPSGFIGHGASPPLVLIGMMGAGKSTIGALYAHTNHIKFIDSDAEIAAYAQKSIADIFAQNGEAAFRRLEFDILEQYLTASDAGAYIIAAGGGAFVHEKTRAYLKAHARTIYLQFSRSILCERLRCDDGARPLLAGDDLETRLDALLTEREHIYEQADDTLKLSDESPDQIVKKIQDLLAE